MGAWVCSLWRRCLYVAAIFVSITRTLRWTHTSFLSSLLLPSLPPCLPSSLPSHCTLCASRRAYIVRVNSSHSCNSHLSEFFNLTPPPPPPPPSFKSGS